MKKIILLSLLALGFVLTGCDSYEYNEPVKTVSVLQSELELPCGGGTGTITTEAQGAITAESNSGDWCKVSVAGTTVTVTATPNLSLSNRTAIVTITCGAYSTGVPVTQSPGFFRILGDTSVDNVRWQGDSFTVGFYSDFLPVEAEQVDTWITPTLSGSEISFTVSENPTEEPRAGHFIIRSKGVEHKVAVNQGCRTVYDDLVGEWTLSGYNADGEAASHTVTLTEKSYGVITMTGFGYTTAPYDLTYDFTAKTLTIKTGQSYSLMGMYNLVLMGMDADGYVDDAASIFFRGAYNGNIAAPSFTFSGNGTINGAVVTLAQVVINPANGSILGLWDSLMNDFTLTKNVAEP